MKRFKIISKCLYLIIGLALYSPANSSIINTINGQGYEWLEFSATAGLSRDEVNILLTDINSDLYGYRYATRLETQVLLESYTPNPEELNHWYSYMAPGAQTFFDDFGVLFYDYFDQPQTAITADGVQISFNVGINSYFFYGADDECGKDVSCVGRMYGAAQDNVILAQLTPAVRGFDATIANPYTLPNSAAEWIRASLLVSETMIVPVPVPPSLLLFISGLIGLSITSSKKNISRY
ncbi:MAG: hypothetical protein OEY89_00215 [Gammaproteobacteria bacterium]|nr:hypothetical protein [Gammaproteobacteria bacterium]